MGPTLTDLTKLPDGDLKVTLTEEGREELAAWGDDYRPWDAILALLEHHLCNGWENLAPETIGALTDCELILTDDIEWDDERENIVHLGRAYWHEAYQVEDPVEALRAGGLVLKGVGNEEDE